MINTKNNLANPVIQNRFSLVEILVAIAIIAVLLGLSGAGYTAVQRKIARTRTEATLNKLRVGLESYKSKFGYYPQQPAIGPFLLDINNSSVAGQPQNNFNSFIEYGKISKEDAVFVSGRYMVIDGWKTPVSGRAGSYILYVCPGLLNTSTYDLFSAGNDRKFIWDSTADVNNSVNSDNIWPQGLKTK